MDPKISVAEQLKQKYPEAFNNGLGRYKLSKATLQLRPGVKPIFRPKRPVFFRTRIGRRGKTKNVY
ncbi:unnamed protein product [Heligmosomoides polygyrus]|uniref:Transposase n=1 Tax=Heligmosomoides polygyrus TaxID=6339 RepID=A0A183FU42_HELPZ|nr:unnamed protein product [Heligmosomoides polygyrus]